MRKTIKNRGFKYIIVFLVQILMLLSMTIQPIMTNILGTEILIKTQPFDPRDVFRGDYVQLSYEINDIPLALLDEEILNLQKNTEQYTEFEGLGTKTIYVRLKKDKDFYSVDKATLVEPKDGVFLKGKYQYSIWDETKQGKIKAIRVGYTLDKYFIPENTGKDLEEAARKGKVVARVKVYKGYSLLQDLIPQ